MPVRRLPVRPNLAQLHRQAKEFLRGVHAGDANAIAELREHHPESIDASGSEAGRRAARARAKLRRVELDEAYSGGAARGRDLARRRRHCRHARHG